MTLASILPDRHQCDRWQPCGRLIAQSLAAVAQGDEIFHDSYRFMFVI
jgi:hypothetical protein